MTGRRASLLAGLFLLSCKADAESPGSTYFVAPAVASSAAPAVAPAVVSAGAPSGPKLAFVPAGTGDVAALVRTEALRARADGRRLLVYVGATWCEPCKRFHEAVDQGALDGRLPALRFLEFDLDRDEDRLKAAGYVSQYIPLFAAPQPDGRASGKQLAGSIKGPGAADEITPRLRALLAEVAAP